MFFARLLSLQNLTRFLILDLLTALFLHFSIWKGGSTELSELWARSHSFWKISSTLELSCTLLLLHLVKVKNSYYNISTVNTMWQQRTPAFGV